MAANRLKSVLKILLFGGLGIFLAWFSLRNVPFEELKMHAAKADYFYVVLAMLVGLLSHLLRALRWNQLLQPLGYKVRTTNAFAAILVGYLFNLVVPRSGEVARCGIVQNYDKVPVQTSVGTVVVERIIDLVFLALAFALTFVLEFDRIYGYAKSSILAPVAEMAGRPWFWPVMIVVMLGGMAGFYFLFIRKKQKQAEEKSGGLRKFIDGFLDGLKSIRHLQRPFLFIAYSAGIWLCYYVMLYIGFFAFEGMGDLGPGAALAVFSFGTIGMIVTPGGIGAYPVLLGETLAQYGVNTAEGVSFGWIIWGAQTLLFIITGTISLVILPIINTRKS